MTPAARLRRLHPALVYAAAHLDEDLSLAALAREASPQAGPKVAVILSVVESCRRLRVPLKDYLLDILPGMEDRKLSEIARLTPSRWSAVHT